ncbi:uncharacterized protein LOC143185079 [Calliopsis andreniformis]|uniref:uncharacterized protein LOC143185079 n=1 Tax=Calliopsis andreniformis TaxID=337506 RepID=UPI003FCDA80F
MSQHNIKVAIKVRPLIKREKDENLAIQWVVQDNSIVSTDNEMKKRGDGRFYFDHIFNMNASNLEIFDTIVKPIVDATVNGFNGTVFAYGQTSSGKTYTMMGTIEEPGIIPLAIEYMFDAIADTAGREFLLRVSYLEIYNEKVNDLLNKSATDLKLKEDSSGQVILQCKEEITNCPENVLSIMKKGDKNRRTGETNMNERSSRSHTIFRITIESREAGADSDGAIQVSQLNLVDLAGSERARQTGATGERFKEGRHINMSLSALGLVIMQLSESQDSQKHVNFRDNKLTRLLQNSLGGNAMTAIICAVTPAALEETQCTLSFASRAKSVRNKPQVNEVMSDAALLKRYAKQLAKLQAELNKVKNENRSAEVEEMETKLQEKDRINQLLEERIELLKTRIVSGDTTHQESFKCKSKRRQTWGGPAMSNKHLSVFSSEVGLPPIKEVTSKNSHRKSIMQSVDIANETFQIAFADFELQLFENERERINTDNASDSEEETYITKRNKQRVTFKDDVFTIRSNKNSVILEESSFNTTPEKCNTSTQTMCHEISPSTPKHVLRKYIANLTNDYKELLEYTTLEKQLLCHENHCCTHEDKLQDKAEYIPEVKGQLNHLNLEEERNIERIIAQLYTKLNEVEDQKKIEEDINKKMMKQLEELQVRLQNITSERNEFEYISCELRTQLKTKTAELELKNMTEENIREQEMGKFAVLEKQIKDITLEKETLEHVNTELRKESAKTITELHTQMKNVSSERNEFEYMHRELSAKLARKSLELKELKSHPESLSAEVERVSSEKYQNINTELTQKISELESEITSQEIANQNAIANLESKIITEQTANQEALEHISKLKQEIENITLEKKQLEHVNSQLYNELNKKTLESDKRDDCDYIKENNNLKKRMEDLSETITNIQTENNSPEDQPENQSISCYLPFNKDDTDVSSFMEAEMSQLEETLHLKSQELEEVRNIVQSLKHDIENLQKTICTLTTENMEMATKLTIEQENAKQAELNLQKTIDELYTHISDLTNQKINLESDLSILKEQLESIQSRPSEMFSESQLLTTYQSKIEKLTTENIELSVSITDKNKELENIKESKSLLYDHECIYQEKIAVLTEKNELLLSENNELSTDLIDKIEENDSLKEQNDILKNRIEQLLIKDSNLGDNVEHIKSENNILKAEIAELKTKVKILSNENTEFSNNLFETMENLDHSYNTRSFDNTLHLSTIFNDVSSQVVLQEKDSEAMANEITVLQDKIQHLTRLNEKLSDLKLISCDQCAHLKNLNESHRVLKIETKALNQELEELKIKEQNKSSLINQLNEEISSLKNKLESAVAKEDEFAASATIEYKYKEELIHLKKQYEDLEKSKLQSMETEQHSILKIKELEACIQTLQENIIKQECLCREFEEKGFDLEKRLKESEEEKFILMQKIQTAEANLIQVKNNLESRFKDEFDSMCLQYENRIRESEINFQKLNDTLNKYVDENLNQTKELSRIRNVEQRFNEITNENEQFHNKVELLVNSNDKLANELSDIRQCIVKELNSLKSDINSTDLSNMSTTDIFVLFLQTLVSKEKEIMKTMQEMFEKEQRKLEDEKQQILDTEKRTAVWVKELEAEIEKLKAELTERECDQKEYQNKISHLEHLLIESNREKEILTDKKKELQTDFNTLKTEFDKLQKVDSQQEETIIVAQKKEKEAQETFKNKEEKLEAASNHITELEKSKNQILTELVDIKGKYELALQENAEMKTLKTDLNNLQIEFDKLQKLDSHRKELIFVAQEKEREAQEILKNKELELQVVSNRIVELENMLDDIKGKYELILQENAEMKTLKTDFNLLQTEFDKLQKLNSQQEELILVAQEKEREAQEIFKNKELELQTARNRIVELEQMLIQINGNYDLILQENTDMKTLKTDFNLLQTEFDKLQKLSSQQEELILVAQEKEREAQEIFKNKELELQTANNRIVELEQMLIQINGKYELILRENTDMKTLKTDFNLLQTEFDQLQKVDSQLKETILVAQKKEKEALETFKNKELELQAVSNRIVELENMLDDIKNKYELILQENTEMKTLKTDFNMLQTEFDKLQNINSQQKKTILIAQKKEEEALEILKNKELELQVVSNRIVELENMLDDIKGKYELMLQENAEMKTLKTDFNMLQTEFDKLQKINSQQKEAIVVAHKKEKEMQEAFRNREVELEAASKCIAELEKIKNQISKELIDLKGKYELVLQENAASSDKSEYSLSSFSEEKNKYNRLLLEKNKLALELEDKKLILIGKDKELKDYASRIQKLIEENKELDKELDEYAEVIKERDVEIADLMEKLHISQTENKVTNELEQKLKNLKEENEKLRNDVETSKMNLSIKQTDDYKLQISTLNNENLELQTKLSDYKKQLDYLFQQNVEFKKTLLLRESRQNAIEDGKLIDELKKKIHELELQLVSKNGRIATLEIQIQSENFPYQRKCKELEELLHTFRSKNYELSAEVRKLQRTINDTNTWECEVCRRWRVNRRDQACQTLSTNTLRFCGANSGIVEDHVKIQKLEREKLLMKDLCRSRSRRIKELEDRVKELEAINISSTR